MITAIRLHLTSTLLLLACILSTNGWADGVTGGTVHLIRTRTAESLEIFRLFISVSLNVNDLTNGENSLVQFENPEGDSIITQGSVGRNPTYSVYESFTFDSLAAAAGTWKISFLDGTQAFEDLRIVVPELDDDDFPPYRPFPTFDYDENPQKVFLPWVIGTNQRASVSGISTSNYDSEAGGSVYTAPDGGPYTATTSDYLISPAIAIKSTDDEILYTVTSPQARSETLARFYVGQPRPFEGRCEISDDQVEFNATGLVEGQSYMIRASDDNASWQPLHSFTAISNAHFFTQTRESSRRFFQVVQPD
jgi:hypothetical protein